MEPPFDFREELENRFSKALEEMPFRLPIYSASIDERLADLERTAKSCRNMLKLEPSVPCSEGELERLQSGEFAIGNWIVRPRFKK